LPLHALACNLATIVQTLAMSKALGTGWLIALTSPRERLIKAGAPLARHTRHVVFQVVGAALRRLVFIDAPGLINDPSRPSATLRQS
jgi:hypothetical protein